MDAATRAGGLDEEGREALLKYIFRPAVAQERVTRGPEGLVRIGLKKAFSDGTVAVDLDPLSLLGRLAASVPPPRLHTVRYAGVLASASKVRARIAPSSEEPPAATKPPPNPMTTPVQGQLVHHHRRSELIAKRPPLPRDADRLD